MKSAAILNSRQHLRSVGSDPWINNTKLAVQNLADQNRQLLTSIGMNTWELLVYLAARFNMAQRIYFPVSENVSGSKTIEYASREFKLRSNLIDWRPIGISDIKKDYSIFQKLRDEMIIREADFIYPIALRPNSTLSKSCVEQKKESAIISDQYLTPYDKKGISCKIIVNRGLINNDIDNRLSDFIIHWTRTSNNPWPGEKLYDYYDALTNSTDNYPRSAFNTLLRIVKESKLRSSGRHHRKGIKAVAFSELKPTQAISLMKWRARYGEMTFEPYGIAIRKEAAKNIGIRQVIYGNNDLHEKLDDEYKPYYQSIGSKGFWVPEKEWRHIGDINLTTIEPDAIKVIVWWRHEMKYLRTITNSEIISMYA